jgi:NDP-sugar pyrophosphorylase family protein
MLSDEFYLNANFRDFAACANGDQTVTVAVKTTDDPELIKRNFSVERNGDQIVRLVESPSMVKNDILGMASFIVAPVVLDLLGQAYEKGRPTIDFVDFIDELIRDGHDVRAFDLTGDYINLNDIASLEQAMDHAIRDRLQKAMEA